MRFYGQMLVEEIASDDREKYQWQAKEEKSMLGLSMGSVQTTRTICAHPELFSLRLVFSLALETGDEKFMTNCSKVRRAVLFKGNG